VTDSLRAKSVFRGSKDPYFPRDRMNATFLPTSDDWGFRVQVVSQSTDIHTEMFKKAVQGLIKICFPQNVLNELGVDVVQQHMREQSAPKQNIEKMREIFRSEMVHRLVWMLVEYLDDSSKVEAVVKSVTAASAVIHGDKFGPDILGSVIASLQRLRERVPENSTKTLAEDIVLTEFTSDTANNEDSVVTSVETLAGNELTSSGVSDLSESETEPLVHTKRKNQNNAKVEETSDKPSNRSKHHQHAFGGKEIAAGLTVQPARQGKESKVSTSWRWNVKQSDITVKKSQLFFHRTVDLFAYHALPIAKGVLGHDAGRKDIRLKIESLWTSITDEEYEKWIESFRRLWDGDLDMVDRVEPTSISHEGVISATPAPATTHKRHSERESNRRPNAGYRSATYHRVVSHETTVKQEADPTSVLQEAVLQPESHKQDSAIATPSFASQYSVTPQKVTTDPKSGCCELRLNPPHTPIFDLLWGGKPSVDFEARLRRDIVLVIMDNLDQRIPARVAIPIKSCLQNKHADVFSPPNSIHLKVAQLLEQKLC
jgi:hypothetical protein